MRQNEIVEMKREGWMVSFKGKRDKRKIKINNRTELVL